MNSESTPAANRATTGPGASEFDALLDAAVDAVIVIDDEGRIEVFNAGAEHMFGHRAEDVLGQNVRLLMPEPYRSAHDGYLERYLRTGEAQIIGIGREVTAQRADGSMFPVRLSVGRVRGHPRRFVGIVHDITAQKSSERALELERDRAQSYLDLAEVMLLALDRHCRITLINRKGCEILGSTEQALLGSHWVETCIPADQRAQVEQIFERLMDGEGGHEYEENVIITSTGEERLIAWRNRMITAEDGEIVGTLSSGEDITERRRAEEEARRARDRLTHVSRLSTMGEMAAGLAHEINQPLTAIATYAQACQRMIKASATELPIDLAGALEQIGAQALRAGDIIRRLRSLVRNHVSERELTDCNELVRGAIVLAEADARSNDIELAIDLQTEPLPVNVDQVQIQQVLLNLIRNAIDASEEIQTERRILIRTRRLGKEIEIAVVDRGCGLPADAGDELFNPFYTTKPTGTGLGLSISRSLVRAHGGRLSFLRHDDGPGTTFLFTIPAVDKLKTVPAEEREAG